MLLVKYMHLRLGYGVAITDGSIQTFSMYGQLFCGLGSKGSSGKVKAGHCWYKVNRLNEITIYCFHIAWLLSTAAREVTSPSSGFVIVRMESKAEDRGIRPYVSFVHISAWQFSQGFWSNTLQLARRSILSRMRDIDQHTRIPLFHCLK